MNSTIGTLLRLKRKKYTNLQEKKGEKYIYMKHTENGAKEWFTPKKLHTY